MPREVYRDPLVTIPDARPSIFEFTVRPTVNAAGRKLREGVSLLVDVDNDLDASAEGLNIPAKRVDFSAMVRLSPTTTSRIGAHTH